MADVFVSYARSDKPRVAPLVAAIEAKGWSVWWDPEITPGQEFDDQIDAQIDAAKAVLVVWSPVSVASRWVRGEAREAAERGILVPVRFEQALAIPAHRPRRSTPRRPLPLRPLHHARHTHVEQRRHLPATPAHCSRCRHTLTQIVRIRSRHPC